MKKTLTGLCCLVLLTMTLAGQFSLVEAGNLGGDILINGFGHQTAIKTDTNEYVTSESYEGSFRDYALGLTLTSKVNEKINVQVQILNTQVGFGIDWGFADYRFSEAAGFKFGRVKLPLGLYTEFADVKNLQPFSYLPSMIYGHGMTSYNGAGFYGTADFNDDWSGELEMFGGDSKMKGMTHLEENKMSNFVGGRVSLTTPLSGSRLMVSYMRSKIHMENMNMDVKSRVFLVSGEVIGDMFFVRAEGGNFKNTEDNISWYGEAGYLVHENVQPVARYVYQKKENTPALTLAARNLIGQTDTQKEIGIGVNVFLTDAMVLKVEQHWIDGSAQLNREVFTNDAPENSWSLTSASVAFTF